jgi:hypothetical protein
MQLLKAGRTPAQIINAVQVVSWFLLEVLFSAAVDVDSFARPVENPGI